MFGSRLGGILMIFNMNAGGASTADKVKYDNTESGLQATEVQSAIDEINTNKVDKVSGKQLSTNDYTTTEKNKLAGIATGANKTVVDSSLSTSSTNPVQNKVVTNNINSINKSLTANSKHFYFDYKNGKYGYNTDSSRGADTFFPFSSDLENVTFKTAIDKITDAQIGKKYLIVHGRATGYVPGVLSGATILNSQIYQGNSGTAYEGIFIVKATSTTIVMDGGGCPVIYAEI